jgi:hypothetical protein
MDPSNLHKHTCLTPTQLSAKLTNNASCPKLLAPLASFTAKSVRFWLKWICTTSATASKLPWCFPSNSSACSAFPARARTVPQSNCTVKLSPCTSLNFSASVTAFSLSVSFLLAEKLSEVLVQRGLARFASGVAGFARGDGWFGRSLRASSRRGRGRVGLG